MTEEKDIIVPVKLVTFNRLIDYVSNAIFEDNPDADTATHPFDMPFLDYIIELKTQAIKGAKNEERRRTEESF